LKETCKEPLSFGLTPLFSDFLHPIQVVTPQTDTWHIVNDVNQLHLKGI